MKRTESRTETTKETRTETANGIKTAIQTEVRTETTIETSTETKTEVKTETKTETISEDGVKEITSETTTKSELKSDSPDATEKENKQQTQAEESSFVDENNRDIYTQIERFYKKKQPIWKLKESPELYFELKKKIVELSHGDIELLKACKAHYDSKKDTGITWNAFAVVVALLTGVTIPVLSMINSSNDTLIGAAAGSNTELISDFSIVMQEFIQRLIPVGYFVLGLVIVVAVFTIYKENSQKRIRYIDRLLDDLVSEAEKRNL